ncbi:MAG: hypothetical protein KBT34_09415 [Prevotella sp.]|nr:hypothetical protein [Candidatus Prevotella equi]
MFARTQAVRENSTKPYPTPSPTFFDIMHLIDTLRYAVTNRDTIEA